MSKLSDLRYELDELTDERDQLFNTRFDVTEAVRLDHSDTHPGAFMWCPRASCTAAREVLATQ